MSEKIEAYLENQLKQLEKAYEEILKTKGFNQEAQKIAILKEMIKEQNPNENTMSATR